MTNINVLGLVVSDKKIFPIDSYSERASSQAGSLNSHCAASTGLLGDVAYQISRY